MRLGSLVLLGLAGATPAFADEAVRTGAAAFGDWRTDAPGVRRLITPADLPAPFATRSSANMSQHEAGTGAEIPKAPSGFTVEQFATGLNMPRVLRVAPNGDIFVAETYNGSIRILRAADGASKPDTNGVFAAGLNRPFGIAFFPNGDNPQWVYVGNTDSVVRFPYHSGDLKALGPPETVVASLPRRGAHTTRDIVFTPDNARMLVSNHRSPACRACCIPRVNAASAAACRQRL